MTRTITLLLCLALTGCASSLAGSMTSAPINRDGLYLRSCQYGTGIHSKVCCAYTNTKTGEQQAWCSGMLDLGWKQTGEFWPEFDH